jgi:Protein of unknown function (DUF3106)
VVKAALAYAALIVGLLLAPSAGAQQPQSEAGSVKSARPNWSELSPKQQAVLAPLAAEWDKLDTTRRKKWVTIANRYPKMKPDEQQRLQSRMQDWADLTPAQRRVARENYRSIKQLPRPQRGDVKQKWQQYQQSATPAAEATSLPDAAAPDAPGK